MYRHIVLNLTSLSSDTHYNRSGLGFIHRIPLLYTVAFFKHAHTLFKIKFQIIKYITNNIAVIACFQQICKMTPRFTIGDCAGGHRGDNREKNRDVLIVPRQYIIIIYDKSHLYIIVSRYFKVVYALNPIILENITSILYKTFAFCCSCRFFPFS